MRGIVSAAFTPKHIKKMEDEHQGTVRQIIDQVAPRGGGDLCALITKRCRSGVRQLLRHHRPDQIQYVMTRRADGAWSDPEYAHIGSPLQCSPTRRRSWARWRWSWPSSAANPGEDLMSWCRRPSTRARR